jgi:hypothetical protein
LFDVDKDRSLMAYYPFRRGNIYADASGNGYGLYDSNAAFPPVFDNSTTPFPGAGAALLDNNNVLDSSRQSRSFRVFTRPGLHLRTQIGTAAAPGVGFSICFWFKARDGPTTPGTVNTVDWQVLVAFARFRDVLTASPFHYNDRVRLIRDFVATSSTNIQWDIGPPTTNAISTINNPGQYTRYWTHHCAVFVGRTISTYFNCSNPSCTPTVSTFAYDWPAIEFPFVYIGQSGNDKSFYGWLSEFRMYRKSLSASEVFAIRSYGSTPPAVFGNSPTLLAYYPFRQGNIYLDASGNGYDLGDANTGGGYSPTFDGGTTAPFPGAGVAYFNNAAGNQVTTATGSLIQAFRVNVGTGWNLYPYIGLAATPGPGFSWCYWIRGQDGPTTPGTLNTIGYPFVFTIGNVFKPVNDASFTGFYDGRNNGNTNGGGGANYWVNGVPNQGVGAEGIYTRNWVHVCFTWQGTAFKAYVNCASTACVATASATLTAEAFTGLYTQVLIGQGTYNTAW